MKTFPLTTGELASKLDCELIGKDDTLITGAETVEGAGREDVTFLANRKYRKYFGECGAGAIILSQDENITEFADRLHNSMARIISKQPYEDFRRTVELLYGSETAEFEGISEFAVISESASIGNNVTIAPFVHICDDAVVGDGTVILTGSYIGVGAVTGHDCMIGVNVAIRHEVKCGDRVWIGDGSVIGYDGFGYVPGANGYKRIRPVGRVEIGDDVHIGANTCIDRATVGATRIDKGSKLDNLIQIAHGVEIGQQTAIAAQTGISGSVRIGNRVMVGGQAGFVGHIEIGDGMQIGAQSGINHDWDSSSLITGCPARPIIEMRKIDAHVGKLPEMSKLVKQLEKRVTQLEEQLNSKS